MKQYTVVSKNPEFTYHYGIFETRAIAAIMLKGLELTYAGQEFEVIELP
jgi:hypothetical protein